MPLPAGARLGPYEILAPLGAGGMGEVYRARDTRLERTVAIKVLPSHLSSNEELRQRLEREARAVSSLNHPHICTLHDIGNQDGMDFLVMEYLEGETLLSRLQRGPLPTEEIFKHSIQIADALDKAHRQGVVHRDLKPGNVMLTKSGAKLLDFGLAKRSGPASEAAGLTVSPTLSKPLTAQGSIVGTFQYMAPEQLEGVEVDTRTDIFAFGAVLYEMATGRRAFHGKSQASLIASILHVDPPPIATLQPLAPAALDHVVSRCLAKDPDERWQSVKDLKLELEWISGGGSPAGVSAPRPASGRRREALVWSLVALLAVAAVGLGLAYRRAASVPPPRVVRSSINSPEKTTFRSTGFGSGPVAVSPDGSRLTFSARRQDGTESLWVRPLDSATAVSLAGTQGAYYPFWSADSRSIGFFAGGKLKKIDAAGGPAVTLCDASNGRGGTWGPDGTIVFTPDQSAGLFRVPEAGGAPTPLTQLDKSRHEGTHRWPQFLPGGRRFIYLSRSATTADENKIMVASLDGEEPRLLIRERSNAVYASGHLLFIRETTLMAQPFDADRLTVRGDPFPVAEQVQYDGSFSRGVFSASANGVLAYQQGTAQLGSMLTWVDKSGKRLGDLGDKAEYIDLSLSADLTKAAVVISDPRVGPPDLWIYDVGRGIRTRFTFDPGPDNRPVWSPDGSKVVFASNRKGDFDIYVKDYAGSSDETVLVEGEYDQLPSSISEDGRYLAYFDRNVPETLSDIWVVSLQGERKPEPFMKTRFTEANPRFSPDGRWIAYVSDESEQREVYVAPFPGPGRKWQVSSNGGITPRWRRDSREIYYVTADNKVMAVQVGQERGTFQVGAARPLFELPPQSAVIFYDVSPDGQKFLVNTAPEAQDSSPLTLVLNWTAGFERLQTPRP